MPHLLRSLPRVMASHRPNQNVKHKRERASCCCSPARLVVVVPVAVVAAGAGRVTEALWLCLLWFGLQYPRAEEHLIRKTSTGAVVSVLGIFMMAVLGVAELRLFLTPFTSTDMRVDVKGA